MNRRSMIKSAALGASATLVATTEAHSEPTSAARVERPTQVVNAIGTNKKPIPLACTAHVQRWQYRLVNVNRQAPKVMENLVFEGLDGWEAVCLLDNHNLLCKKPL